MQSVDIRNEINSTLTHGSKFTLGAFGFYLFNLIDAYFFYDYKVPIADRYKNINLTFQFYSPYNAINKSKESICEIQFSYSF